MELGSALSPRQEKMLDAIRQFTEENGYPPTIRQIGEMVGISSTSVVSYNLGVLQRKGLLTRDREVSRGLRLGAGGKPSVINLVSVPLLGVIAAGEPLPIPDSDFADAYEQIALPSEFSRSSEGIYALRVRGTSMIDALIDDGDIVVMRHQRTANDGDLVAAWLKDEKATTLKRLYREKNHQIRLQPANPLLGPI